MKSPTGWVDPNPDDFWLHWNAWCRRIREYAAARERRRAAK